MPKEVENAIDNQTQVLDKLLEGIKSEKNNDILTRNQKLEIELGQFEREAALKGEIA